MNFSTKKIESELNDADWQVNGELLVQLFDHAPDVAFFVKDREGRYVFVNESLVERSGLRSKSDLIGKRSQDVFPGDLGRVPTSQDQSVLRSGRPIYDRLELHWYSLGKSGWCLTTKLPLKNARGELIGLIGISRDVRSPNDSPDLPNELTLALEHLEKNLSEPITASGLAALARLSLPRFTRHIKRIYRLTPGQLITKTRLAAASELLRETKRSVADIATACGFCDHSAFTRAFRTATGQTPSRFREHR